MYAVTVASFGLLGGAAPSCASPAPPPPQEVRVMVSDDGDRALEGAELRVLGHVVTTTDRAGSAQLTLNGTEGETFELEVGCPPGHRGPRQPIVLVRQTLAGSDAHVIPEHRARCVRTERVVVVAFRATGGPTSIPIRYLGAEVARTDARGNALVSMRLAQGAPYSLTLDTGSAPNLHPIDPTFQGEAHEDDELLAFDVRFTVDQKPKHKVAPRVGPKAL